MINEKLKDKIDKCIRENDIEALKKYVDRFTKKGKENIRKYLKSIPVKSMLNNDTKVAFELLLNLD